VIQPYAVPRASRGDQDRILSRPEGLLVSEIRICRSDNRHRPAAIQAKSGRLLAIPMLSFSGRLFATASAMSSPLRVFRFLILLLGGLLVASSAGSNIVWGD
jgi:hypothetical protein